MDDDQVFLFGSGVCVIPANTLKVGTVLKIRVVVPPGAPALDGMCVIEGRPALAIRKRRRIRRP